MIWFLHRLGPCSAIARYAGSASASAHWAAEFQVEHIQGEVIAVARFSGGIVLLVREAVAMAGANANFEFGQGYCPEVRDEDEIPEGSDAGNRDGADAFDQ